MRLLCKKMAAVVILVLWSVSASATVIENLSERDWLYGDSALTYDESTGLEWLDLDLTAGMNLNQIHTSGILNVFRWATTWEVESLLDAALVGFDNRQSNELDDNNNAMKWIDYLGRTGGEQEVRWSQGYTIWRDWDQGGASVLQMYGVSAIDCADYIKYYGNGNPESCSNPTTNVIEGQPIYDHELGGSTPAFSFTEIIATSSWGMTGPGGAMLVRDARYINVSEPFILSIFGLGFVCLCFSRRKKKS